jgi:signal transduction histidine kinase
MVNERLAGTAGSATASGDAAAGRTSPLVAIAIGGLLAGVLALTVSAQTYLSMRGHGHSFVRILAWQLACWSCWAAATPLVLRAGRAALSPHLRWRYGQVALLGVALTGAHSVIAAQLTVWLQPFTPAETRGFTDAVVTQLGLLLAIDLLVYAVVLVIGGALAASDRAHRLEVRESRLAAELARAHLDALRLEIQPHFLFNTLNAIAALIRRQSGARALEMLVGLSDLMRATLDRAPGHVVTLERELALVAKYVDLYRVRFADRLEVSYDVDAAVLSCGVPTFALQPLVENAFRHGLADRPGRLHLEIGARPESDGVRIWVADDGAGVPAGFLVSEDAGTGLNNVASRLRSLFGADARLDVRARETGGTVATILLPGIGAAVQERAAS